ncbi:MAG: transposase [Chloroflexi bacterium]|nr:transposase [Chloroflexota bacterium]
MRRQRKVTGAGFAQTLVLGGLMAPAATRREQQHHAVQVGMPISTQGLEQRFTATAVTFMRQLLEEGLRQTIRSEQQGTVLPSFNGVYISDCSRVEWLATGVKLAVRWELQRGQLEIQLRELRENDQKSAVVDAALPEGALHLNDLGFFKLTRFQRWNEQGVFWLTRFKVGTTVFTTEGEPLDLLQHLKQLPGPQCLPVQVGNQARLSAYLIAAPHPAPSAANADGAAKRTSTAGPTPDLPRQTAFARWTIYLTNIPDLTFDQAHTLARTRWQIELLFKLWKSHGQILRSRTADPCRQLCQGYAKLLAVLVAHWMLLVAGWSLDNLGSLDALRLVRTHTPLLMRAFTCPPLWRVLWLWLTADLRLAARRSKRAKVPLAFQLWQVFDFSWS